MSFTSCCVTYDLPFRSACAFEDMYKLMLDLGDAPYSMYFPSSIEYFSGCLVASMSLIMYFSIFSSQYTFFTSSCPVIISLGESIGINLKSSNDWVVILVFRISSSSSVFGYSTITLYKNLSTCASGNLYVPNCSSGF